MSKISMNLTEKKPQHQVSTATPGSLQSDMQFCTQDDTIARQVAAATVVTHFQGAETHFLTF